MLTTKVQMKVYFDVLTNYSHYYPIIFKLNKPAFSMYTNLCGLINKRCKKITASSKVDNCPVRVNWFTFRCSMLEVWEVNTLSDLLRHCINDPKSVLKQTRSSSSSYGTCICKQVHLLTFFIGLTISRQRRSVFVLLWNCNSICYLELFPCFN